MKPPSRIESLETITRHRVVAIIRLEDATGLSPVVEALAVGGIRTVEVTVTMPGAIEAIAALSGSLESRVLIGAGTVLDAETARAAILAGARFVVAPTFRPAVVELCHRYDIVAIPGAFTPTEILTAWEAGADLVKVFPAGSLGPGYVRNVLGPLPQVRLLMTGGVTAENGGEFLSAGAVAVGVGGALVDREVVARRDYARIEEEARRVTSMVGATRETAR